MRIRCDRAKMHQTMDCFGKYSSYQQRFMFQGDAIIQWKEKTESKRNERCICALSYVASNCVRVFEPRLATLRHKNSPPCSRFCAFNSLWFCFCIFFSLHSILKVDSRRFVCLRHFVYHKKRAGQRREKMNAKERLQMIIGWTGNRVQG